MFRHFATTDNSQEWYYNINDKSNPRIWYFLLHGIPYTIRHSNVICILRIYYFHLSWLLFQVRYAINIWFVVIPYGMINLSDNNNKRKKKNKNKIHNFRTFQMKKWQSTKDHFPYMFKKVYSEKCQSIRFEQTFYFHYDKVRKNENIKEFIYREGHMRRQKISYDIHSKCNSLIYWS